MSSSAMFRGQRFTRPDEIPPLRPDPFTPDSADRMRAEYVMGLWHEQDDRLRQRDRQVEENVRMLLGQQWIVWSDMMGRYVDLSEYLDDDEKRWRHFPVLNRLFLWFILTHARMNENPPVISWQPGPDQIDADLAEVMNDLYKYVWRDVGMIEALDRLTAWLIPSGRAHIKTRIDAMKGDPIPAIGPATLQLMGPEGRPILGPDGRPIEREIEDAPFDADGNVRGQLVQDEQGMIFEEGEPHVFHQGGFDVDVLTCLEVRGTWGEHIPWHKKPQHLQRSLLTPLEVWETFGVECEPDIRGEQSENVGIIWRLLHGTGLWGAAEQREGAALQSTSMREFCTIYELHHAPSRLPGMEKTPDSPGGRFTIVSGSGEVIRDGVRVAPFKYTSPIRCFDFQNLPGRPQGTSPQEMLNGAIRTRNRLHGQGIQHATLVANPTRVANRDAGIKVGDIKNVPGETILASFGDSRGEDILHYVSPGRLGPEVYESADRLADEIDTLGSITGAEGSPPTTDASGELVKELRFNSDRPLAGPMRRMVIELARWGEDIKVMGPLVWDEETVLQIAGSDNIPRTITVFPELFEEGTINAEPEVESMLPEGRGERQAKAFRFWQAGVWGDPTAPEAINMFLDQARFPHMGQMVRPGGPDRAMAAQNVGKLLQGTPAVQIPILEVYDHEIHLGVLVRFMKTPEYLKVAPETMEQIELYRQRLMQAQMIAAQNAARQQLLTEAPIAAAQAEASAEIEGGAESTRQAVAPPPERVQETTSPEQVA